MAYNYEYPYVDPERYNDDWALGKIKELDDRMSEVEAAEKAFEEQITTEFNNHKQEVQQMIENFESNILDELDGWKAQVEQDISGWEAQAEADLLLKFNQYTAQADSKYNAFVQEVDSKITSFENEVNTKLTSMQNTISEQSNVITTFTQSITNEMTQFQTTVSNSLTQIREEMTEFESDINGKIETQNGKLASMQAQIDALTPGSGSNGELYEFYFPKDVPIYLYAPASRFTGYVTLLEGIGYNVILREYEVDSTFSNLLIMLKDFSSAGNVLIIVDINDETITPLAPISTWSPAVEAMKQIFSFNVFIAFLNLPSITAITQVSLANIKSYNHRMTAFHWFMNAFLRSTCSRLTPPGTCQIHFAWIGSPTSGNTAMKQLMYDIRGTHLRTVGNRTYTDTGSLLHELDIAIEVEMGEYIEVTITRPASRAFSAADTNQALLASGLCIPVNVALESRLYENGGTLQNTIPSISQNTSSFNIYVFSPSGSTKWRTILCARYMGAQTP